MTQVMRVLGLTLFLLLAASRPADAAIAYNGDAAIFTGTPGAGTFGGTFNATLGTDNILIAVVSTDSAAAVLSFNVTYGGLALTFLRSDCTGTVCQSIYYRVAPAASGSLLADPAPDDWNTARLMAFTYSGVSQSTPIGAHNGAAGTPGASPWSLSMSITPTNSASRLAQISNIRTGGCAPTAFSTSQGTTRYTNFSSVNNTHGEALSDWAPGTSGTPVSFNHNYTCSTGGGSFFTVAAVELLPASPPPTATRTATRTPTRTPTPTLPLVKSANVAVAAVGSTITYCVAWTNDSSSALTRTFYDQLAPQLTYLGGQAGCGAVAQLVTCSFATSANTSGSKCFWVLVNSSP